MRVRTGMKVNRRSLDTLQRRVADVARKRPAVDGPVNGDDELQTALVVAEFGDRNEAERAPLRKTFASSSTRRRIALDMRDAARRILDGEAPDVAMAPVGEHAAEAIRHTIESGLAPPLAESTIKRVGDRGPLDVADVLEVIGSRPAKR